jgi:hypothetical protein
MNKYIITYFYHDSKDQGASYGNISLPLDERNIIYWQTVYTLFFSSIVENKNSGVSYALFTNVAAFPFRDLIEGLGVMIYDNLSLTVRNPGKWATVKFFFDVLEYIDRHNDFDDDDAFVMLDTDVVALRSATPLFDYLQASKSAIAYVFEELTGKDQVFHGINISNLEGIGLNAFGRRMNIKNLIGGEFFCFNKYQISECTSYFRVFSNPNFYSQITTEEQILTLVNSQKPWAVFHGAIYRVWTTLSVFKLPEKNTNYLFLHLPAEKEFGLSKLFNATKDLDPYMMTETNFSIMFHRCTHLHRPFFLYISKIVNKFFLFSPIKSRVYKRLARVNVNNS